MKEKCICIIIIQVQAFVQTLHWELGFENSHRNRDQHSNASLVPQFAKGLTVQAMDGAFCMEFLQLLDQTLSKTKKIHSQALYNNLTASKTEPLLLQPKTKNSNPRAVKSSLTRILQYKDEHSCKRKHEITSSTYHSFTSCSLLSRRFHKDPLTIPLPTQRTTCIPMRTNNSRWQ